MVQRMTFKGHLVKHPVDRSGDLSGPIRVVLSFRTTHGEWPGAPLRELEYVERTRPIAIIVQVRASRPQNAGGGHKGVLYRRTGFWPRVKSEVAARVSVGESSQALIFDS